MKKKKSILSKKEKLIIFVIPVIALLIIILITMSFTKKVSKENKNSENDLNQELTTVKQVVEYLEGKYISMSDSSEDGYDLDIFVEFRYNLYEGDESKEIYFKNFYEKIASVTERKSFRIIDNNKGITIEVKSTTNGISEVKINGEKDYYRIENSKRSAKNKIVAQMVDLSIDSEELSKLISVNWKTSNVDLGSKEGTYYKYDIYFDEGYEIRTIKGKVYNIVFTDKYKGKVVGGYKVGTSLEKIKSDLGTTYTERQIIGYKTENFYIWFSEDEISIYPYYKTDYTEFEELAKEFNEKKDANKFMDKITDIWQDYDLYEHKQNYVKIRYANKGVCFEYSVANPAGVTIYENYRGNLKNEIDNYKKLFYRFDKNLTGEAELARRETKVFYDDKDVEGDPIHHSRKFDLLMTANGDNYINIKIKSSDGSFPNNEFDETLEINSYVWADDTHFIYSIYEDGIYIYDAENRTTEKLLSGKEEFKITDYDRNTNIIKYDDKQAKITY